MRKKFLDFMLFVFQNNFFVVIVNVIYNIVYPSAGRVDIMKQSAIFKLSNH